MPISAALMSGRRGWRQFQSQSRSLPPAPPRRRSGARAEHAYNAAAGPQADVPSSPGGRRPCGPPNQPVVTPQPARQATSEGTDGSTTTELRCTTMYGERSEFKVIG